MTQMQKIYLLIPLLPLLAAVVVGLFGRVLPRFTAHLFTITGVGASFVLSLIVFQDVLAGHVYNGAVYTWMESGGLKLEVGFMTGSGSSAYDVYLTLSNTNADGYGYRNDGQWHNVSIPIAALRTAGAPAFGTSAPTSRFDLTRVTHPFSIGDRYGSTGNAGGAAVGSTVKVYVDEIYWSK